MLNAIDGEFKSGAGLRVYETKIGRLGIAVAEDLYFPEILRTLSVCGSDLILCPFGIISDSTESVLLRAGAFSYGVTMCPVSYTHLDVYKRQPLFLSARGAR